MPTFIKRYSNEIDGDENSARSWYLEPNPQNGFSDHGIIQYGASGFSEEIRDRKTRTVQYSRRPSDIGTIPLYYRLWVPETGDFGLIALQSFGARSCVGKFIDAFAKGFRKENDKVSITFPPIVPSQIAKFANGEVKTLSLTKHDYSSDAASNQIGEHSDLVDLDVTFKAKPRSSLGSLKSFTEKFIGGKKDKVLEYNNTHFDEATAEVVVGKKRRKIVLLGVSPNAGKFDLTEDVDKVGGHPVFASISKECEEIFTSIMSS